ncbi:hypothetical protein BDN72DRAFT_873603 [Pluteus cervinus]|uniref:Uncharacterized protein n=1 Tax=Pluteus cervinus TaxID=181527 RepID=A0ACD3BHI5_9AGAR|nr:hypothetical protein BDN72DRAFT_873603 [Pluteus cervinus]
MATIPVPTLVTPRETWEDTDFDLPDDSIDDGEDWDIEMDLGKTGGAKAKAVVAGIAARSESSSSNTPTHAISIRPPLPQPQDLDDDDDDEGVSTIKVAALPKPIPKSNGPPPPIDEDFEGDFAIPNNLTQLSLAPLSLNHRSSRHSLEWGDRDQTSSSQSSDAYSSLGFTDASPSSNSASSVSLPDTETSEDDEDDLEGLVIPPSLFDTHQGKRHLTTILEAKKKAQYAGPQSKTAKPDPEEDFEIGLLIEDDVDLSPSRLLHNTQQPQKSHQSHARSKTLPAQRPPLRPSSRLRSDRAKSPFNAPPPASARQLEKLRLSPSPPLTQSRSQNFQSLASAPITSPTTSFLSVKPGSLRGQKSHSGLKPPTPPGSIRKVLRKASLSSLFDNNAQASGSGSNTAPRAARYEEPTAASRAKSHKNSTSRMHAPEFKVPPTRPSTPSSNTAAIRLTMPTQSRLKSRPTVSGLFSNAVASSSSSSRATSPVHPPPRPPSTTSLRSMRAATLQPAPTKQPSAPKILRKPKRQLTYGDGTELDGFEDLPTNREQEARYHVQPKGFGNRIPGGSYPHLAPEKGTIRRKSKLESAGVPTEPPLPPGRGLRRSSRVDFPKPTISVDPIPKKKRHASATSPNYTRRKPTLIRNLNSATAPKVIGDMKWNPQTLRWEGNDHVLRDFDAAIGTSTRPALITHLTGSSIGSPVGTFASGARIVGNMIFDPTRMCWISALPPDEDEPDVFANLADDEEDEDWEAKGGTIRASLQGLVSDASSITGVNSSASSDNLPDAPSPARSHTRTISESGSDRGSRASMVYDVDDSFAEKCRLAEERHRREMKGWKTTLARHDVFTEPDRSWLYDIRAVATRQY